MSNYNIADTDVFWQFSLHAKAGEAVSKGLGSTVTARSKMDNLTRFGPFDVDLRTGELRKKGLRIRLQHKPFQILSLLLEHPGELVTREELHRRLWPDETFVDFDNGLNTALNKLRNALGDSPEKPRYIETLPRRGYRFQVPVVKPESLASRIIMMAVLPFENLSGDEEQEYFSDGLTEEMITQLARLNPERLRVTARTSSLRYKKSPKGISEIARELNVKWILEGSVRRAGDRVRITAQLIRVEDESHLWAQNYDRELRDILTIQSEVALAIADEIHVKLNSDAQARSREFVRVNPEAYRTSLLGSHHLARFNREGITRGIDYLLQSIAIDPSYARPYEDLAFGYFISSGWILPSLEAMSKAKEVATKALDIDKNLVGAHVALGIVHLRYDWDWVAAETRFKCAVGINAGSARAQEFYGWYLAAMGRFDEAIERGRRALELDPVSSRVNTLLGHVLYLARRYDEAVEQLQSALELDEKYWFAHLILGLAMQQQGNLRAAIAQFQRAALEEPLSPETMGALGQAYAVAGEIDKALEVLDTLDKWSKHYYVSPFHRGRIYAALGRIDEVFAWFEAAYEERSFYLSWFKVEPELDPLRSDPRFQSLLQRLVFPSQ
jgi:TolB-like protein/DNA-binding SARP family transcriptional activator